MEPALTDGCWVLVDRRAYAHRPPTAGDVVMAQQSPGGPSIVKRVFAVISTGEVELRGDNAEHSTDSRDFGPLPLSAVSGRVVFRYWPRPGRIPPTGP